MSYVRWIQREVSLEIIISDWSQHLNKISVITGEKRYTIDKGSISQGVYD